MRNPSEINLVEDDLAKGALHALMQHAQGRDLVWKLLQAAGVAPGRVTDNFAGNALQNAYAQGYRGYGVMLQAFAIEAAPEFFHLMLKEQTDAQNA